MELEDREKDAIVEVAAIEEQPTASLLLLARIFSVVLHPLFMAIYGISLLFIYTDFKYIYGSQFSKFIIPVAIFSCFIPMLCIYLFWRTGYVTDFSLKKKEERFLPFLTTFFSYSVLFYYFFKAGLAIWFLAILLVPLLLLVICGIVNSYWKISAHMAGIGGLLGSIFSVCYNIKGQNPYGLFIILIILVGVLGVSRLILRRHTPAQVYVGFLVGLVVSYFAVFVGGYFPLLILWLR